MTRRTVITILIGILAAAVIGGIWWWFFASGGAPTPAQTGTFGSSGTRTPPAQEQSQTPPTNIPGTVSQAGQGNTAGTGGIIGVVNYGVPPLAMGGSIASSSVPNVNWLAGGGPGTAGGGPGIHSGSGTPFTPSAINQLNNGQVGGSVNVLGTYGNPDNSTGGSGAGAIIGIAGTAVACTAFLVGGAAGISSAALTSVSVNAPTDNTKNFMDCLARTIARAAIQQLTNSVVNWINSGFNGSPSFVTNYQQFFENVADQAAGSFIQNYTNFAPFCTPFRNQIRIALAQSYARRNAGAPSCTLSSLLGTNTQTLFGGKYNGWGNLLSFTTVPSNNPYGAYMSAQVQLQGTIANATGLANRNLTPSGFLNYQEPYDCTVVDTGDFNSKGEPITSKPQCKYRTTTPGSVIEASLNKTLGTSIDSLNLAKSFDEIISALITQLMSRALYGGLSNLSGQNGYAGYYLTPDQQQAQSLGQEVLTEMQGLVVVAQQYGQSEQGSIQDIQGAQQQLNTLANCWQTAASSTDDLAKQKTANDAAQSALSTLHSFDPQVDSLNDQITRANAAIAFLQDEQTKTLNVGSTGDVGDIRTALAAAQGRGDLVATTEVTQAQQDRSSLQSQLSSLNQQTQNGLQQCNAFVSSI